jgi:CubicO group peptidase (beta-lactamase class C family)
MDTSFHAVCEAAAAEWSVPALAVGWSTPAGSGSLALGCDLTSRFRIASITKPIAATVVLALLDVEEPTGVWPEDVRVRHLLSHTSGFDCELPDGDYARFGDGDGALAACVTELGGVPRLVGSDDIWSYANTGYWLAGHLAAERGDASFEELVRDRVLAPAGLEATSFAEPDLAGHGRDLPAPPYPRARRPSGGLTSTVEDLLRFGRFHLAGAQAPAMRTVRGKPVGGVYGLGLFGERVGGVEVWGHPGSYGGFESSFLTVPARGAVFVGLTNVERGSKALKQVEDAFFERVVGEPRRVPPFVSLPAERYAAFAGSYANTDGPVEVRHEGGDELVVASAGEEVRVRPIGERTFRVPAGDHVGERLDFPRDGFARFGSRLAVRTA